MLQPNERRKELFSKSIILNWLIAGFQDFMARGVDLPEPMTRLKTQLLEAADPVGVFLDEMTLKEASGRLSVSDFYKVYEASPRNAEARAAAEAAITDLAQRIAAVSGLCQTT